MGHSQAEKAASRERILEAAARQIREGGLDSLSISELMKQADLTHGGFYGHFPSRAALITAALDRALAQSDAAFGAGPPDLARLLDAYLSPLHRDDRSHGCAIAALACDAARADPDVRGQMAARVEQTIARIGSAVGGANADDARDAATLALCAMVGALSLSRVTEGTPLSDRILEVVRTRLMDLGTAPASPA